LKGSVTTLQMVERMSMVSAYQKAPAEARALWLLGKSILILKGKWQLIL
jgi:hypothetical protein